MKRLLLALALLWPFSASAQQIGNLSGGSGGGSSTPCVTTPSSLQYDAAGAFGCVSNFTSNGSNVTIGSSGTLTGPDSGTWTSAGINALVGLYGASNVLPIVNGTNAQIVDVYNTETSAFANYERGVLGWCTSNVFCVGTQAGGTGSTRNMEFVIGGTNKLDYGVTVSGEWYFNNSISIGNSSTAYLALSASSSVVAFYAVNGAGTKPFSFFDGGGNYDNADPIYTAIFGLGASGGSSTPDTFLSRATTNTLQIGTSVSSPNASGSLLLTNLTASGALTNSGIASTAQADVVCTTSAGLFSYQISATGCAASSERFKNMLTALSDDEKVHLASCLTMAKRWTYKDPNFGDPSEYVGFTAEQVARCDDRFITYDADKLPYAVKHQQLAETAIAGFAVMLRRQQAEIEQLKQKMR